MRYVSTRGNAPVLSFSDTILAGLARDGGLYVPEHIPVLEPARIAGFAARSYADVAKAVMLPFIGPDFERQAFERIVEASYGADIFGHPAVTPLVQIAPNRFILELFHGPTLAFKDLALQFLGRLIDHALAKEKRRATIVGATSGDTGSAAIEAFRGRANTDIFILFPEGRVSDVQRRQMTTVVDENVHALAIRGSFDDAQALVKGLFQDHALRERLQLAAVNSINWGRILAQVVYYFTAAVALGAPHRPVSFTVPTGNFGDIFAGYIAKRMGLPVGRLVIATNENAILAQTLASGTYATRPAVATLSPSMDISVSSNFERLLFEVHDRDGAATRRVMDHLAQSGAVTLHPDALQRIRDDFSAARITDDETRATIKALHERTGYVCDPHTAVGVAAATHVERKGETMVVLGTAHPAKFPESVAAASGIFPALPARLGALLTKPERQSVLDYDLTALKTFMMERSRAAGVLH